MQLSKYQNTLFRTALMGPKILEQDKLYPREKEKLQHRYLKAQKVIRILKNKIEVNSISKLLSQFSKNTTNTNKFIHLFNDLPNDFYNPFSFKDLGIKQETIINIFIDNNILPQNFYKQIKDPNWIPKLKTK